MGKKENAVPSLFSNGTPLERAVDAATERRFGAFESSLYRGIGGMAQDDDRMRRLPISYLWDPMACPEPFLSHLAWAWNLDDWSDHWPERIRRKRILDALRYHRVKGSRKAVEEVFESFGAQAVLKEWWETDPAGPPHTFQVYLNALENVARLEALELKGAFGLYSVRPIRVHPGRRYRIRMKVRQLVADPGKNLVYGGVATLDSKFRNLTGGAGTHRYCAVCADSLMPEEGWKTYEGEISGTGDTSSQFRPGTAYVRPMVLVNYRGGTGVARVADIEMWDLFENRQLIDATGFDSFKSMWSVGFEGETVSPIDFGEMKEDSLGMTGNYQKAILRAVEKVKPVRSSFSVHGCVGGLSELQFGGFGRLLHFKRMECEA